MKQLLQDLRTHAIAVEEVPAPGCQPGGVLVKTAVSLISSGTERVTVKLGNMSLVGKAIERPDLLKSLFRRLQTTGVASVLATVRDKLDRALAPGYSAAGEVLEVGEGAENFKWGNAWPARASVMPATPNKSGFRKICACQCQKTWITIPQRSWRWDQSLCKLCVWLKSRSVSMWRLLAWDWSAS